MKQDIENAVKAAQTADLLCADLLEMVKSKDVSLVALVMFEDATKLRDRISNVAATLKEDE